MFVLKYTTVMKESTAEYKRLLQMRRRSPDETDLMDKCKKDADSLILALKHVSDWTTMNDASFNCMKVTDSPTTNNSLEASQRWFKEKRSKLNNNFLLLYKCKCNN